MVVLCIVFCVCILYIVSVYCFPSHDDTLQDFWPRTISKLHIDTIFAFYYFIIIFAKKNVSLSLLLFLSMLTSIYFSTHSSSSTTLISASLALSVSSSAFALKGNIRQHRLSDTLAIRSLRCVWVDWVSALVTAWHSSRLCGYQLVLQEPYHLFSYSFTASGKEKTAIYVRAHFGFALCTCVHTRAHSCFLWHVFSKKYITPPLI